MQSFIVYDICWDQADIDDQFEPDEMDELYNSLPTSTVIALEVPPNTTPQELQLLLIRAVERNEGILIVDLSYDDQYEVQPNYVHQTAAAA